MAKRDDSQLLHKKLAESRVRMKGSSLYLTPSEALDFKKNFCAGCGNKKINPCKYYGEEFCGQCVERWSSGH